MPIDPQIQRKLQAFDRRRRQLLLVRGACAGMLTLLGLALLLACVDRFVVMSDKLRLIAGLLMYGLSFSSLLAMGFLQSLRRENPKRLALMLAERQPDLKHEVLAAVELGTVETSSPFDSLLLREMAQQRVSEQLSTLQPRLVLPWNLLRKWLVSSTILVVILSSLLCTPGVRLRELLHRVMMPWANLSRVSSLQIQVLRPSPTDGFAPENEPVPVEVGVTGSAEHGVMLEVIYAEQPAITLNMSPLQTDHFVADLPMGHEPLEYRVHAEDAMTRRMKLMPKPRPQAISFVKNYQLPPYTHLPDRRVEEPRGDLESLQSSVATLTLNLDQPVQKATLTFMRGDVITEQAMSLNDPLHPTTQIKFEAPGQYELSLVSAQTGYENSFKPKYPVRVIPDLPPEISLLEPAQDLVEPPNGSVQIRLMAQDDLGLADVQCMLSINQSEWKNIPWAQNISARKWTTDRRLDLYELALSPGDEVVYKFSASDNKGQISHTAPRKITVSVPGFDPRRQIVMAARQKAAVSVNDLAQAIEKARDAAKSAVDADPSGSNSPSPADALKKQQSLAAAQAAMKIVQEQTERTWTQIQQSLRATDQDQDANELVAMGQVVSRLRHQELQAAPIAMTQPSTLPTAAPILDRAATVARGAQRALNQANVATQAETLAQDLKNLAQQQQLATQQANTANTAQNAPQTAQRLAQQENNILTQARQIAQQLNALEPLLPPGVAPQMQGINRELKSAAVKLEKSIAAKTDVNQEIALGLEAQALLTNAATAARDVASTVEREAQPARMDLANVALRLDAPLQGLLHPTAADLHAAGNILLDRAKLQEARHEPNAELAMDLDRAARTVEAQAEATATSSEKNAVQSLKNVADSLRKIAVANQLEKAVTATKQASEREKDEPAQTAGDRAQAWQQTERKIQLLPEAAIHAQVEKPLAESFQNAAKELPEINREMTRRSRAADNQTRSLAGPLDRLTQSLEKAQQQLEPLAAAARKELAQNAPPVSATMRRLASEADRLSTQSAENAAKPNDPSTGASTAQSQAKHIEQDQAKLNQQVDKLSDTLRRDAGQQDPLSSNGRERARDDDDALALLKDAKERTQTRTQEAANAGENPQESLRGASREQKQMATKLQQLADHFEQLQKDSSPPTRAALRQAEAQLGIDRALETEQKRLEKLARAAEATDQERRALLEKELANDPQMRQALSEINARITQRAARDLQQASQNEQAVNSDLGKLAEKKKTEETTLAAKAAELGRDLKQFSQNNLAGVVDQSRAAQAGVKALSKAQQAADAGKQAADELNKEEAANAAAIAQHAESAAKAMRESREKLAAVSKELTNAAAAVQQRKNQAQKEVAVAEKTVKSMETKLAQTAATPNSVEAASLGTALAEARENLGELQNGLAKATQASEQIKQANEQTSAATSQSQTLSQRASNLSNEARRRVEQQIAAIQQAQQQQQAVQNQVSQTAQDLARTAAQEKILQRDEHAAALTQQAQHANASARGEVAQARQGLDHAPLETSTQQKLQAAQDVLAKQAKELEQMNSAPGKNASDRSEKQDGSDAREPSEQAGSQQESAALASALDAINKQANPGNSDNSTNQTNATAAAKALAQAARQRANAQQQARQNGQSFSSDSSLTSAPAVDGAAIPAAATAMTNDQSWSKLRSSPAQQMSVSKRDMVPADYQVLVDRYFRALAERDNQGSTTGPGATRP